MLERLQKINLYLCVPVSLLVYIFMFFGGLFGILEGGLNATIAEEVSALWYLYLGWAGMTICLTLSSFVTKKEK